MKRSRLHVHKDYRGEKTAMYVFMHARYQQKRGKNPSESYKNERNPRKALQRAIKDLQTYEPGCGEFIVTAAAQAIAVARLIGKRVSMKFNGIRLVVLPTSSLEEINKKYSVTCEKRSEAYRKTPECKRQEAVAARRRRALQAKADQLCARFGKLNFGDLGAVIDWLDELQEPSDHVGVAIPVKEIVEIFREYDYEPSVNCGSKFVEHDSDNSGRWLIGQALDGLNEVGAIHPVFRDFAKKWRNKFYGLVPVVVASTQPIVN